MEPSLLDRGPFYHPTSVVKAPAPAPGSELGEVHTTAMVLVR